MTCFAIEPSSGLNKQINIENLKSILSSHWMIELNLVNFWTHRFTSSALWAMKKPWVFAKIFTRRGLIEIFVSFPSSPPFISIANSKSFSLMKQSLSCLRVVFLMRKWNRMRKMRKFVVFYWISKRMFNLTFAFHAQQKTLKNAFWSVFD